MKLIIFFVAVLFYSSCDQNNNSGDIVNKTNRLSEIIIEGQGKEEYYLKGKIINVVELGSHCGYLKLASVIEFEIIAFSNKKYNRKTIAVIFRCAEFYGENFFEIGKIYEMTIEPQIENDEKYAYQIQNRKILDKYQFENAFWIISVNKFK